MGLFNKLKNIFYDEEYVVTPVLEQKENEKPKIEEMVLPKEVKEVEEKSLSNTFSERDLFKSETTFNFPVFDEEDEEEEENIVLPPKTNNVIELEKRTSRSETIYKETPKPAQPQEPRVFKPSPIISPVYGILNKNYKKEEIRERKETQYVPEKDRNFDYVRRKAYGTLEDDIEHTIKTEPLSINLEESVNDIEREIDSLDKSNKDIEDLLNEIEVNSNLSIGELEESMKDKMEFEEDEQYEESLKDDLEDIKLDKSLEETISDSTLEHDLFNLIDSMYEDKED